MEKDEINQLTEKIYIGLNSKNKDELITEIILSTDLDKRIEISNAYLRKYDLDLYSDLKSKLNGQFKELAAHLFLPPEEFMAKMLKRGLKSFAIDESLIYEIFTTCTQEELKLIELAFKKMRTGLIENLIKKYPQLKDEPHKLARIHNNNIGNDFIYFSI